MTSRRDGLRRLAAFGLAALLAGPIAPSAIAADVRAASSFIDALGQDTIEVLRQGLPPAEREQRLGSLLARGFDLGYLARLAIGRGWRDMTDAQKQSFQDAFDVWVLRTYAGRLQVYTGERFIVNNATPAGDDVMVQSQIMSAAGVPTRIDWRVRDTEGGVKIVDVVVEGVSMVVTHRNEFQTIIQRQGIDGLIATLRSRAERPPAPPA